MEVEKFLISEEHNLIETMQLLDQCAMKILFVIRNERLVAAITDGDIRRWILRKGSLEASVKDFANYSPLFIKQDEKSKAKEMLQKQKLEALPVIDELGRVVEIVFKNIVNSSIRGKLDVPIVIMAGGIGSRLYPYTKILPKPLIPIGEIPIVEHIINRFYSSGAEAFFLIVNHKKNMIKAYFNETERPYLVQFVDEDKPLGTGGGLSLLKGVINSTFILTNCDILIEEDYEKILKYHRKEKNLITMVCSLKNIRIPYGVIEINQKGEIENMKEKPVLSFFTNTGVYVVESSVIDALEPNVSIGFPDVIEHYKKNGHKIGIYPISENSWMDMGQLDEMESMRRRLVGDE